VDQQRREIANKKGALIRVTGTLVYINGGTPRKKKNKRKKKHPIKVST